MFSKEIIEQDEAMRKRWQEKRAEMYGKKEFGAVTSSGIPLRPVYTPVDIEEMNYDEIPLPGEYPYTRGFRPLGYQVEPWETFTAFGFGTVDDSRKRWEYLRSIGGAGRVDGAERQLTPFRLLVDIPTNRGYDPDAPEARGRVGGCGISLSNLEDMERLLDGVPLEKVCLQLIVTGPSLTALAMYVVYAQRRGVPLESLLMRLSASFYRQWCNDIFVFSPKHGLRLMVELINYCTKNLPRAQHISLAGYEAGEGGTTPVQEIAFILAMAITITEECVRVGLDPDDVVPGFHMHDWVGMDFFENIAKFRAKRRIWSKVFKEKFGCKKPASLCCKLIPQTGGTQSVAQEPLNNIVRVTLMALSCILGGCDGVFTTSYDEPLSIPTEDAVRMSLRTQQIIYHETNIPHVTDPLGGSYYIEWLTNEMEKEATKLLQRIDELGGGFKCWESGWLRKEVIDSANERQRKIDSGDVVIVGQNKYRLPDDLQPKIPIFSDHDPAAEEEAIARVRKFRERRDSNRAQASLAGVRDAARALADDWPDSCGILMPAIIDAVKADATLGEIQGVLEEVFGNVYIQ